MKKSIKIGLAVAIALPIVGGWTNENSRAAAA